MFRIVSLFPGVPVLLETLHEIDLVVNRGIATIEKTESARPLSHPWVAAPSVC